MPFAITRSSRIAILPDQNQSSRTASGAIFQVDAVHSRLSDPKPGGVAAGTEISRSLCLRLEMIIPSRRSPERYSTVQSAATLACHHALNHLQINSKRGLVYAGDPSGAYRKPNNAAPIGAKLPVSGDVPQRQRHRQSCDQTDQSRMGEEHREDQRTDGHHHQIG